MRASKNHYSLLFQKITTTITIIPKVTTKIIITIIIIWLPLLYFLFILFLLLSKSKLLLLLLFIPISLLLLLLSISLSLLLSPYITILTSTSTYIITDNNTPIYISPIITSILSLLLLSQYQPLPHQ